MRRRLGALLALGLTLAACGDDGASAPADSAASTGPSVPVDSTMADPPDTSGPVTIDSDPIDPDTTDPDTTAPSSTSATTEPTTSAGPTTPPLPTGWAVSDFVPGAWQLGYSGNWAGEAGPSPAAPTGDEPPADGYYVASVREPWDPDRPDHLAVRIQRLEWCPTLPDGCEYMEPSEMNLDPAWQLDLDLPLDATTDVVVGGFRCWDAVEQKQGTGVELADLFAAYTADYATAIAPRLTGTTADWQLALDVAAAPTGGFVSEQSICPGGLAGPLRYVHDDAPVLLLQTVADWDGGPLDATDLVRLGGVQYTDGVPVFYFFAGFIS